MTMPPPPLRQGTSSSQQSMQGLGAPGQQAAFDQPQPRGVVEDVAPSLPAAPLRPAAAASCSTAQGRTCMAQGVNCAVCAGCVL